MVQLKKPEKELTLYINIPYCNSKCHFCVYVAHIKTEDLIKQKALHASYVEALKIQIKKHAPIFQERGYRIHSIYFGGGTPTSLSTDQLIDILATLKGNLEFSSNYVDTTLETTPENVVGHDFKRLRLAGFDRISMGVQSMLDGRLKRLGRCHSQSQVTSALKTFHEAGINNINIDLMVGLPDESDEEISQSLGEAIYLNNNHFTIYMYIPAEGSVFKKKLTKYYSEDELLNKYLQAKKIMTDHGYMEYQWQYFSKDKTRCICDTTYFGLTTEWFAFGSTGNSLLNQKVIKGPAHHKDFIDRPLRPGQIFAARNASEYLELHYNLAITCERGLNVDLWQDRLGISFVDTLKRNDYINASHHYLLERNWLSEKQGCFSFTSDVNRARYSCMRLAIDHNREEVEKFNNINKRLIPEEETQL
jgi:oxygen-independent coproporphyrinogen III oxidase